MFTKKGNPTKALTHAIRQIQDWRAWLKRNYDYASRERNKRGLGLVDIDSNIPGLILIGRRNSIDPSTHELRRQMVQDLNIKIHTYDTLYRLGSVTNEMGRRGKKENRRTIG